MNHMITTAKYVSHHFTGKGENAIQPFSYYMSMGAFCCHGNQTKRQIIIISTISPNYGQLIYMALEELPFENVNGWASGHMDDRQEVITITHPEHRSDELKRKVNLCCIQKSNYPGHAHLDINGYSHKKRWNSYFLGVVLLLFGSGIPAFYKRGIPDSYF